MLQCAYKASLDNMRRALELVVMAAYFDAFQMTSDKGRMWLDSYAKTPYFRKTVEALSCRSRFHLITNEQNWVEDICNLYYSLCDAIHTKGQKYSLSELQQTNIRMSGTAVPQFNAKKLANVLDLFIRTVQLIAVTLAAYNPILLVKLPYDEKFGENPFLSGFFENGQTELLWTVIPQTYHSCFRKIVETDDEVKSILDWFSNNSPSEDNSR